MSSDTNQSRQKPSVHATHSFQQAVNRALVLEWKTSHSLLFLSVPHIKTRNAQLPSPPVTSITKYALSYRIIEISRKAHGMWRTEHFYICLCYYSWKIQLYWTQRLWLERMYNSPFQHHHGWTAQITHRALESHSNRTQRQLLFMSDLLKMNSAWDRATLLVSKLIYNP